MFTKLLEMARGFLVIFVVTAGFTAVMLCVFVLLSGSEFISGTTV